ncbi:MAG: radical SAM family heme chaperone HemW [Gammaproteobacteria bacterium]|jgi:oxygen-independent coproporphyrinogen-3 oxidase|nr:radical SAM family heme chaperone HemW [Gammaproteobacteria bacterium]MDP6616951.1 radical SAM family heme chaperone HemW [Gammaproteobacteria bacterium]MDP6694623.1 radical SAM family heme chaperone HemW [Gammaproteobacteria bacterium]
MDRLPPLSLYLHFPWCVAKCPYCDFNSHSLSGELPAETYVDALLIDLESAAAEAGDRPVISVFLGGGTPSLFPAGQLERLLSAADDHLNLAGDAEVTLEANPGAVGHAAFAGYKAAGINRLSIGAQSFADDKLAKLGRIHSSRDVLDAYREARAAGFDNINLDVMYALPEQTLAEACDDISAACDLQPEHISHYHLTLEPHTVFHARPPALPDQDLAWEMHVACADKLAASGYINYEVSAWSQAGHECRHNLNYWRFGDYLGLGAGAHAKLTCADGTIWREVRAAHPRAYLGQQQDGELPVARTQVCETDVPFEFVLNALRLKEGFSLQLFERHTGLPAASIAAPLRAAGEKDLIRAPGTNQVVPSDRGWRFLDDLQTLFLPQ